MELETNDTELSTASFERELSLVVAITLLFISLGSIVANAMLLSAIYNDHYKCFRSPPIYFIANLAFADLLTGIFVDSLYAVYDLGFYLDKEYLIILTVGDYASYITVNNAVCTIIFLSIDRSIAIKKPFFYRRNITAKTVAVIIAVDVLRIFQHVSTYGNGRLTIHHVGHLPTRHLRLLNTLLSLRFHLP